MKNALTLAPRLAVERLRGARGGAALDVFAIVAFTVASFLALTVAGGTWMFVQWNNEGNSRMEENLGIAGGMAEGFTTFYVVLAGIACALLVLPILSLGGAAARLGARGRAGRLASLRLIGMTGGEVIAISVVETLVQAVIGTVFGAILWLLSLPLWGMVTFQSVPLLASEMRGPWWLGLAVVGVILLLAVLSTILGLQRVRISPLGVAARQTPPAIRWWRVIVFVVVVVAAFAYTQWMQIDPNAMWVLGVMAGFIAVTLLAINLLGPFVIQMIARIGVRTNSVPRLLAMRRIVEDPKAAWRNVSSLAFLGFLAAFVAVIPLEEMVATDGEQTAMMAMDMIMMQDLRTGVLITLAMGFAVGAVSTLISQSSGVVDRADESRALDHMGMPRKVFAASRRHQVLLPLAVTLTISLGLGLMFAAPILTQALDMESTGIILVASTVVAGFVLSLLAAEACRPLQASVLGEVKRRND